MTIDITLDSAVEDIVQAWPEAVTYLLDRHRIRVICCGAPIWATIRQLAETHDVDANTLLDGLRSHLSQGSRA